MINDQECMKILNTGERKYTVEEVRLIRDLLTKLATIELEDFKTKTNNKGN